MSICFLKIESLYPWQQQALLMHVLPKQDKPWRMFCKTVWLLKCPCLRLECCCLFQLKDWRMIQEERAVYFYRSHTLRRVLRALLDFVNQERLLEWDLQELAEKHNSRWVTLDFPICWVLWGSQGDISFSEILILYYIKLMKCKWRQRLIRVQAAAMNVLLCS